MIKNTDVNCNVIHVLRDSWWWQPLLFHIMRATKRKEEMQMDMITLSNVQKKLWFPSGFKRCVPECS